MPSGWSESCREQRRFRNLQVCTSQKYSAVPARLTQVLYPPASHTVRLESINLLMARALPVARLGGRNGNDDRSYLSREFRSRITSFGTLTTAVAQSGTPADPRPQGRLRGAQTGQKRAKTRVKEIDLPKKAPLRGLPPAHTRRLQLGGVCN